LYVLSHYLKLGAFDFKVQDTVLLKCYQQDARTEVIHLPYIILLL